uniref:Uncharacterized protein n=1 Tax=Tetraselmis sp. GSL018 TaxID=582737 RepID=A0A061RML9_9CHLO
MGTELPGEEPDPLSEDAPLSVGRLPHTPTLRTRTLLGTRSPPLAQRLMRRQPQWTAATPARAAPPKACAGPSCPFHLPPHVPTPLFSRAPAVTDHREAAERCGAGVRHGQPEQHL